jgi:alpha-mannosidase
VAVCARRCARAGRTFATACRLLERYPDYHFSCSQPQLYAYVRGQHFPALYGEIQALGCARGVGPAAGGMWVESDCNVPSGESLIRQILRGLAFFRQ